MKLSTPGVERDASRASSHGHADKPDLRRVNGLSWAILAFAGLVFTNLLSESGQLRATNWWVNVFVVVLACLSPAILLVIRLVTPYTRAKWWIVGGLTPMALIFGYALFVLMFVSSTPPTLIKSIALKSSDGTAQTIRCLRTSEFLSSAVDIQREQQILPGIVWSVPLHHEIGAVGVAASLTDKDHLQCNFSIDADIDGGYRDKSVMVLVR